MTLPFHGLTGSPLASEYLRLSESEYHGGLEQPQHGHGAAYITSVVAGGYEERVGRAIRRVQQHRILFHSADEEHAVRFVAPSTTIFRIQPRTRLLDDARLAGAELEPAFRIPSPAIQQIVARIRQTYRSADPLAPLTLDGLACDLLAAAGPSRRRHLTKLAGTERVRDAIDTAPARLRPLRPFKTT